MIENISVSFSGGRSSAYMLHLLLEEWGGLPDHVKVLFANTGKEMPETLEFVEECSQRWSVPITWLEYRRPAEFVIVDFSTCSRQGEPFAELIQHREMLPNPVSRFCTVELKVRTMHRHLFSIGWEEWTSCVGIRADEPRRVAKLPNQDYGKQEERRAPLAERGVSAEDVGKFWRAQPFDLELPNVNGKTAHGNCDLCFLKSASRVASLVAEEPTRADWWIAQELYALGVADGNGALFRTDRPNYAAMKYIALNQIDMVREYDESIECGVCID